MDFDGDGRKDVLSGSWPGQIYVFRQQADGAYAAGEVLNDKDGQPIRPAKKGDKQGGNASVAFAADWDGDGDLDLLAGNIQGEVFLIPNEGTAKAHAFGKAQPLDADGSPIKAPHGDAGPVVADWDLDGKPDLLVGCGDGSVQWYRNRGSDKAPALAKPVELVPASTNPPGLPEAGKAEGEDVPRPGMRSKVCVADWNGDGKPDLLLGDFASARPKPRTLTDEQKAERDKGREEMQRLIQEYVRLQPEQPEESDDDDAAARQAKKEADDPAAAEKAAQINKLRERLSELSQKLGELEDQPTFHGWVWVYLRQVDQRNAAQDRSARAEQQ